jgi:hypothetical protein
MARSILRLPLFLLSLLSLMPVSAALAQSSTDPASPSAAGPRRAFLLLGGALELGGDPVAVVDFQDGSKQKVNAGQGGTFFAGGQWDLGKGGHWALRATLGIKYVTTKATNANITLTRLPIRVSGLYRIDTKWWVAAGAVNHLAIRFNAGGLGQDMAFTGTLSPTFEVGYRAVSFVFTPMTYRDEAGQSYRAGSGGLAFNLPVRGRPKR